MPGETDLGALTESRRSLGLGLLQHALVLCELVLDMKSCMSFYAAIFPLICKGTAWSPFKKDLSIETTFSQVHLAGQYL